MSSSITTTTYSDSPGASSKRPALGSIETTPSKRPRPSTAASKPQHEVETATPGLKVFPGPRTNYSATYRGFLWSYHIPGLLSHRFRCTYYNRKCHATLQLSLNYKDVLDETHAARGSHNHDADEVLCYQRHLNSKLRQAANSSTDTTASIFSSHLTSIPAEVQGALTKMDHSRRLIRSHRESSGTPKVSAPSRDKLPILYGLYKTTSGEDFVKFDSGAEQDRIIIFSTNSNLQFLQQCHHWFADGTFKTSPLLFEQLYVISGLRVSGPDVGCFPLVFCLTPNRTGETYRRILRNLQQLQPGLSPASVMSDFEKASLIAYADVFPGAERKGCFFHFRQANKRHIQGDSNLRPISEDPVVKLNLRMLHALAFVPPNDVHYALSALLETPFFMENTLVLDDYMNYFMRTWIGSLNFRGARSAPLFPIPLWNCRDSVLSDLPKTNNFSEGFNRSFSSLLSVHHPSFSKFVEALLKEHSLVTCNFEQFNASNCRSPSLHNIRVKCRLRKAVEKYGYVPVLDFLRGVAHNL